MNIPIVYRIEIKENVLRHVIKEFGDHANIVILKCDSDYYEDYYDDYEDYYDNYIYHEIQYDFKEYPHCIDTFAIHYHFRKIIQMPYGYVDRKRIANKDEVVEDNKNKRLKIQDSE